MPELDLAVIEFNDQKFYDAHEILELLWQEAPQEERNFYQGLLQIAAGFYHLQQNNENGAKILIGEGIYRLKKYPDRYLDLDLAALVIASKNLLSALQRSAEIPPFPKLTSVPEGS